MVVVKRTGGDIAWTEGRDVWYHELLEAASEDCPAEEWIQKIHCLSLYIGFNR
jgi:acetyl-coenzyme A synthetase (EC 6.2.1.1)